MRGSKIDREPGWCWCGFGRDGGGWNRRSCCRRWRSAGCCWRCCQTTIQKFPDAIDTLTALNADAQSDAQIAEGAGAEFNSLANLPVGDRLTDTQIHGVDLLVKAFEDILKTAFRQFGCPNASLQPLASMDSPCLLRSSGFAMTCG